MSVIGSIDRDTIVAIATPPGRGGIGILRCSGPLSLSIAEAVLGKRPTARHAHFADFLDEQGRLIDQGIALYFPAPHSFTGEEVLELQGHGGPVVLDLLLQRALRLGARLARPGEFSERAFLNDKIDLLQAEAIADLIDSSSVAAARSALQSLQGEFSRQINQLVERLIRLRVYIEASIDFPDEELDLLADPQIGQQLLDVSNHFRAILSKAKDGQRLRDGMSVVIIGRPNAGKSSLLNQLAEHDRAIVTDIPGTTRDLLHEEITLQGVPLHLTDTAGLRQASDPIEQEGIRRARQQADQADCVLLLVDATADRSHWLEPIDADRNDPLWQRLTLVRNKIDLLDEVPKMTQEAFFAEGERSLTLPVIALSAKTAAGIDLLKQHLLERIQFRPSEEGGFLARRRHLDALLRAQALLEQGQRAFAATGQGELLAEDLREAQQQLDEITGRFGSEALLSRIFSSFCIGK
ncbi:MAG TPA: tRNA uridine-5-carboxymethylaminomethyl(34) synthesis GTPase MnmE [Pseudomonadales bacterium]|nr:tRNA uridine-5-carboxymethylaminomethyl(34) synthesis GTPase MnmE [Pseudomonadales bacterium]